MALLITLILGAFILLGALVTRASADRHLVEQASIAVAFGTMVALAALDLLPEAIEAATEFGTWPLMLAAAVAGVLALKLLDRFIPDHDGEITMSHECSTGNVRHIGMITAIAVTLHNLIEGMAVFGVAADSLPSGLVVALGVGLHNVPMGMVIYSTLETASRAKKTAFLAAASLSTFAGGLAMSLLWLSIDEAAIGVLVSLTLGMIAYIVLFELLPHLLHAPHKGRSAVCALAGVAVVAVASLLG